MSPENPNNKNAITNNMAANVTNIKAAEPGPFSPRTTEATRARISISLRSYPTSVDLTHDFEERCDDEENEENDMMCCDHDYTHTTHGSSYQLEDKYEEHDGVCCDHAQIDASNERGYDVVHFPGHCVHGVSDDENEIYNNIFEYDLMKAAIIAENDRLNMEVDEILEMDSLLGDDEISDLLLLSTQ